MWGERQKNKKTEKLSEHLSTRRHSSATVTSSTYLEKVCCGCCIQFAFVYHFDCHLLSCEDVPRQFDHSKVTPSKGSLKVVQPGNLSSFHVCSAATQLVVTPVLARSLYLHPLSYTYSVSPLKASPSYVLSLSLPPQHLHQRSVEYPGSKGNW